MFFFLMNEKNQPWNTIECISVCLILPDVRQPPPIALVAYPYGCLHTFPHCLGPAHFLWLIIELCCGLYISVCLTCAQVLPGSSCSGTPRASKFSASLCFSDTEPVTQLLHTPRQCYEFSQQLWQEHLNMTAKVWNILQNYLQKGHSLFAGKTVPPVIQIQTAKCTETPPSSILYTTKALQGPLQQFQSLMLFQTFCLKYWNTAVSGILLLNTLLSLFECNIQKVPLNEKICSSVFSEPHNVYNVWIISPPFPLF